MKIFLQLAALLFISFTVKGQFYLNPILSGINTINTAVPFLRIDPDARSGGMGDAGIASCDDIHSIFWNTAKLSFGEKKSGAAITYTPWLKELVNDIFLADASGYWMINNKNAVTASIRYFSLGSISFTDANGHVLDNYNPYEYTMHVGYARKVARDFSAGINFGYVNSNLASGVSVNGVPIHAATSIMGDLSFCYSHSFQKESLFRKLNFGLAVSNMGSKISYTSLEVNGDFLPANLGIGGAVYIQPYEKNILCFAFDANKLMVPTPDSTGKFRKLSVLQGALQSFNDAPGGLAEELTEINYSAGAEYAFDNRYFFRTGFFYEYPNKGNRQYITVGAGYQFHFLQLNASYLVSTSNQKNPLDNTMRFGLSFLFPSSKIRKEK